MTDQRVHWGVAIAAAVVAEITLIVATIAWVAFYSYVVNPGQPVAAYHQHAAFAGPWVSVLTGLPVFYGIGRWWIRTTRTALAFVIVYVLGDAGILLLAYDPSVALPAGMVAASYATKVGVGLLGARHAERAQVAAKR